MLRLTLWINVASHQKDLVKSKFLWTDDRVSLYGLTLRLIKKTAYQSEINAASHQKDLVKSKFLWTDGRVSLYGSMPRLIKKTQSQGRVSLTIFTASYQGVGFAYS